MQQIVSNLDIPPAARCLDLGCGIGKMTPAFLHHGCSYTGVDISKTAIDSASAEYPDAEFIVGNIAELPFDEPFDVILERTVLILSLIHI